MTISLDKIIPYQPPLPPKPSQSFIINPFPPKPSSLIHPLPQRPHSRNKSPRCPNFIPSPVIEEPTCPLPLDTNVFDKALEVWSNMPNRNAAFVDTVSEDMDRQQGHNSSEGRANNSREPPPGECSRSESLRPAHHDDETGPEALAAFMEPAQQVHEVVAQTGPGSQRCGSCPSQNTALLEPPQPFFKDPNTDQPNDVWIETERPAVVNMSDASSRSPDSSSADTPTRSPSVEIRDSFDESPVIISVPDRLHPNALPSDTIFDETLPTLLHNEGARTGSIAGFVEEIPSCAAHEVTAEVAHCSELRIPQICESASGSQGAEMVNGADSSEAVPTDVADPAHTNTLHASSWDMTPQSTETTTQPPGVHVRDCAPESQAIVSAEDGFDPSGISSGTALDENLELEAGPIMQDDDDREILNSRQGNRAIKETASNCSRTSTSCMPRTLRSHAKSTVAIVIPTAPPDTPRAPKPTRRSRRAPCGKRKYRLESPENSDDPDNSDDGDYIDTTRYADGEHRPTKRSRQTPTKDGDQSTSRTQVGSRSGSLTLPDLRTIAQGTLTCEFFPDHILYLLSWTEKRESADHQSKENVPRPASRAPELSKAQEIDSGTIQKVHRRKEWTDEENIRLTRLVEEDGLSWPRIKKRFPRRTQAEIRLQYDKIKNVV